MLLNRHAALVAIWLCAACGTPCAQGRARVVAVLDGDTVVIDDERTIRLASIDAPELHGDIPECGAREARDALAARVLGRIVRLRTSEQTCTDHYGRTVARLMVDGEDIGQTLLSEGLACAWPDLDQAPSNYAQAARLARDRSRGNWHTCAAFCSGQ